MRSSGPAPIIRSRISRTEFEWNTDAFRPSGSATYLYPSSQRHEKLQRRRSDLPQVPFRGSRDCRLPDEPTSSRVLIGRLDPR